MRGSRRTCDNSKTNRRQTVKAGAAPADTRYQPTRAHPGPRSLRSSWVRGLIHKVAVVRVGRGLIRNFVAVLDGRGRRLDQVVCTVTERHTSRIPRPVCCVDDTKQRRVGCGNPDNVRSSGLFFKCHSNRGRRCAFGFGVTVALLCSKEQPRSVSVVFVSATPPLPPRSTRTPRSQAAGPATSTMVPALPPSCLCAGAAWGGQSGNPSACL